MVPATGWWTESSELMVRVALESQTLSALNEVGPELFHQYWVKSKCVFACCNALVLC